MTEPLSFELSRPNAPAPRLPEADVNAPSPWDVLPKAALRARPPELPRLSEPEIMRHYSRLASMNYSISEQFYPLGSCTMKYNPVVNEAAAALPGFAGLHPYQDEASVQGALELMWRLERALCAVVGVERVTLQPAAGAHGEWTALRMIKAYHHSRGDARTEVLVPDSAHGTNPASAQMAGMQVVVTKCDVEGNVDLADLKAKCEQHSARLGAVMITYPSTYGVFDTQVKELCALVHSHGGRVYIDGANMNALVGVAAPGEFGGDVSHLNLHKTFCIPHGGGGPGVGPVCVVADLVPFLPAHRSAGPGVDKQIGAISAAPLGNAAVLPISWMYMRMMGAEGLQAATETAILSANYIAARLADSYEVHYSGNIAGIKGGGVAHECILDLRPLKDSTGGPEGISAEDVAKRLIDYGFHAPTLSFPVAGTLMVEPTESESLEELDRFCDAMIAIRAEIAKVESGQWPQADNPLKNAPHTAEALLKNDWAHAYSREEAAYPMASLRKSKYWSPVGRVDNVWGDRNLFCTCPPLSSDEA